MPARRGRLRAHSVVEVGLDALRPGARPSLLVCATGGHLAQLHALAPRLDWVDGDRLWVTFDSPQSRSLLSGEPAVFVPYTGPRDAARVLLNAANAVGLMRLMKYRAVVSTGSAIALSFLPLARALGYPTIYIESAARATGPSLTGRMLGLIPGVKCYTQYESWAGPRWQYMGSVFDDFVAESPAVPREVRKIVVTLGTIEGYGFPRLVRKVNEIVPEGIETFWQLGDTGLQDLGVQGVKGVRSVPARELERRLSEADVVISHAGVGSAMAALSAGKCPILVPRLAVRGEHVDDHQVEIAVELERRGLAIRREVGQLRFGDLAEAAERSIRRVDDAEWRSLACG
jgi:UDP-N-acetylglucosamine--N-acetylmuramyl-(pentapeptide) pyrophosphoryl-undecaprenol N-acetylglucosamine transferase